MISCISLLINKFETTILIEYQEVVQHTPSSDYPSSRRIIGAAQVQVFDSLVGDVLPQQETTLLYLLYYYDYPILRCPSLLFGSFPYSSSPPSMPIIPLLSLLRKRFHFLLPSFFPRLISLFDWIHLSLLPTPPPPPQVTILSSRLLNNT